VGGVEITHADRPLWPGITKLDLAQYWQEVAAHALPGLARRPLAIVRCPDGIEGERFFQKHGHGYVPAQVREGTASRQPYLAIDDVDGLVAMAQMSAIELHPWGATEADALHPDRLVFDLDPGEGVGFGELVRAALEVRERLRKLRLESFCRTTGGKGLHVVAPLRPRADWEQTRLFCHAFAEDMAHDQPDRFVSHVKIADRRGKILVDWLRNGLGATAVASYSPRARPGACVATPLAWSEVKEGLDPADFTLRTIPKRLKSKRSTAWAGYDAVEQVLPELPTDPAPAKPRRRAAASSRKD
jgi:bifunctional non-homologous end joining protein LigD